MVPICNSLIEIDSPDETETRRLQLYGKGELIDTTTQRIWQVCKGIVQLSTLYPTGEEALLGWVGPSMCFGPWFTYLETYQAKAVSDVYLMWFSPAEIESSPQLAAQLLPQMNHRLRQMEALLAIGGLRRVEDRLNQLLLLLKQEMGQPVSDGTLLNIRLTHQDIAGAIGTSRVTITRLMGQLKQQGLIGFDSKRKIILKEPAFLAASQCSVLRR
ncbi:Crp/Fnr family transcriptional regulator [Ancylothrix sp. C2]|uniref:Crp/Fnr family transcriptional regulator n=1 Tax=Ancylothrix sp. D3o TaxID=2953691 RepID=UPI0021BB78B0|nr:Crp/Fnr family transcriptional regulator [Ancylothrix sp. D3o]MCT7950947.1 Crp/Fnr family transcriptional regulator [Ancylothrix sp. D3o]